MIDIEKSIEYGADALGFVSGYVNSPRNLDFGKLKELISAVPPYVSTTVVSPASNPALAEIAKEVRPTLFQLYGTPELDLHKIVDSKAIVQTVRPLDEGESLTHKCLELSENCAGIHFDISSHYSSNERDSQKDGKGKADTSDLWRLCRNVRDRIHPFPMILAGGLNAENVREAVEIVKPYAVDVSSGVESSPGSKDETKLRRFISNAKHAIH